MKTVGKCTWHMGHLHPISGAWILVLTLLLIAGVYWGAPWEAVSGGSGDWRLGMQGLGLNSMVAAWPIPTCCEPVDGSFLPLSLCLLKKLKTKADILNNAITHVFFCQVGAKKKTEFSICSLHLWNEIKANKPSKLTEFSLENPGSMQNGINGIPMTTSKRHSIHCSCLAWADSGDVLYLGSLIYS